MGPWRDALARLQAARSRLRSHALLSLTTVLLLQISIASARPGYDLRALATTFGLVLLLVVALLVAAIDALLTRVARAGRAVALDVGAIVAREYPRAVALARTLRERSAALQQRAVHLAARARARIAPVVAASRARALSAAARSRARALPILAALRTLALPVASRARAALPRVPVPALSPRGIRAAAITVTMTFVFATIIGTTGLIKQRGSVALGASTTLTIISGSVSLQPAPSEEFRAVQDGALLRAGMTIRTDADAYAVLTYFEGSTVSIDPSTTLVIRSLYANPDGTTVISMEQQIGRTWHSVTRLLNPGSKYEVRTPSATATVRGTAFAVAVQLDPSGEVESVVETTEGAVATSKAPTPQEPQPAEEVVVRPGQQVSVKTSVPLEQPKPAPEPERKVTVTIGASASVVLDPVGRANGIKDGKVVVQTPGATVREVEGKLVITLPNIPDGKLATVVDPKVVSRAVEVETVVSEKGKAEQKATQRLERAPGVAAQPQPGAAQPGTAQVPAAIVGSVEVKKGAAPVEAQVTEQQKKDLASNVKVAEAPKIEVATSAGANDQGNGDRKRDERSDKGGGGAGSGPGGSTPSGFVPAVSLPVLPVGDEQAAKVEKAREQAKEAEQRSGERPKEQPKEPPKVEAPRAEAPAGRGQEPPKKDTSTADTGGLVPKLELPRIELSKGDAPKQEAPKADQPKADAPRAEAPKPEAPKADAPKQDVKQEAPKAEPPKQDKQDAQKQDKQDAPKQEAPRSDTRSEPSGFVPKLELPSIPLSRDNEKKDDKDTAPKK